MAGCTMVLGSPVFANLHRYLFCDRCSSISATQSFDMRVYGRTGFGPGGAATLGRPAPKPKLDNKFYYYGSTRGQKKSTSQKEGAAALTPRPLLPSQRALGCETRLGPSPTPPKVCSPQSLKSTITDLQEKHQNCGISGVNLFTYLPTQKFLCSIYSRDPQ